MVRLQEEIRDQLMALEALKMEYANAQLECRAGDERVKMLTSEVIGLEEKALRLRSNELKLERDLEKTNDEMTSYEYDIHPGVFYAYNSKYLYINSPRTNLRNR